MILKEKYISSWENSEKPDAARIILSNDAYAICEFIEKLMNTMRMVGI
jgi:ATP-dependent Clp protease adapter protein ClpS